MMGQAVEQGCGHLGVAEDGRPFAKGEVGGDDDRGALVEPAHEVEEQLPAGLGEGQVTEFVEDDEVAAGARLGVAQILLIDNDIVDQTNLNRLHGANQTDADAMRPKVEVVARAITELGLGVRAAPINAWVDDPACRDALKCCDVVFGCTDDHDGRSFINRFAYYYLAPVIDIGLAIDVNDATVPEINALDGRVTVLMPEHTCLMCQEVIDPKVAADQALKRKNPAEYEKRKAEAYVFGEGNPSPAVVTFTTELACMGVNELIHRLQGFRGEDGHAPNRVRKFHLNEDRRPGRAPQNYCQVCGSDENWGVGDVEPFIGRVD